MRLPPANPQPHLSLNSLLNSVGHLTWGPALKGLNEPRAILLTILVIYPFEVTPLHYSLVCIGANAITVCITVTA